MDLTLTIYSPIYLQFCMFVREFVCPCACLLSWAGFDAGDPESQSCPNGRLTFPPAPHFPTSTPRKLTTALNCLKPNVLGWRYSLVSAYPHD